MKEHTAGGQAANARMITKLMFRLLPLQVLLAVVNAINGIVSSLFASNHIGVHAMSAIALFGPINLLISAIGTMLYCGATIICGVYMGRNELQKVRRVFSLDMIISGVISLLFTALLLALSLFSLTGFLTRDAAVRPIFERYLLGQAIGVFPLVFGNQLAAFLTLENRVKRTTCASLAYIAVNIALDFLFVWVLRMEAFGLALASSLGMWVFFGVEAQHFLSSKSSLRLTGSQLRLSEGIEILKTGFSSAIGYVYQTLRGLIVNHLVELFVGAIGLSAFAASDNLLRIVWGVPTGMLAVSRLMISVSVGEEDRQTLADVMRVMLKRFIPLMCFISAGVILCARPLTELFYRDPAQPVYMMTVWGFRILPLCMPFSILLMHYMCYCESTGRYALAHMLALLDGVVCVAGFTALLIRFMGMNSVYVANVLNGVVTTLVILGFAILKNRRYPRNIEDLLVLPETFGVTGRERMDLSVRSMEEVVTVSQRIQDFCLARGIDSRRAYLVGLSMEEMAGNVVAHGFVKDRKKHSVDVRVVHKGDDVILRVKDDCIPFDPMERQSIMDPEDPTRNIGIRMIFKMAREIRHQNILGMNVLTIRI